MPDRPSEDTAQLLVQRIRDGDQKAGDSFIRCFAKTAAYVGSCHGDEDSCAEAFLCLVSLVQDLREDKDGPREGYNVTNWVIYRMHNWCQERSRQDRLYYIPVSTARLHGWEQPKRVFRTVVNGRAYTPDNADGDPTCKHPIDILDNTPEREELRYELSKEILDSVQTVGERNLLATLAEGVSNREAARRIGMSESWVRCRIRDFKESDLITLVTGSL
jgi:DNA-directed RNA polymerase specialized sigma24 family protein